MKRVVTLLLCLALMLSGCAAPAQGNSHMTAADDVVSTESPEPAQREKTEINTDTATPTADTIATVVPDFTGMDDATLLPYMENAVYSEAITDFNSKEYFIENVEATYISKEYLEESAYNSKENIYFGYSLSELNAAFEGKRYVFTLGSDGQTDVQTLETIPDTTCSDVLKNVAVGSGVILVCVTVSAVSGALGAPAVCMIFAVSAKSGTAVALSSATISALASGFSVGFKTKDFGEAAKAAALSGSENFKVGAFFGALSGGATEAIALKGATLNGLSMDEAAAIQMDSKYPLDVISQFKSVDEYLVYKDAGLYTRMVNGQLALVRDIDLAYESDLAGSTVTNLQRMQAGYAPIDPTTGTAYQLHHVNQEVDGTLAILNAPEHQGNASILNLIGKTGVHNEANLSDTQWAHQREAFWKAFAVGLEA